MRKLLIAASVLFAAPVAAQPRHPPADHDVARHLPPAGAVDALGERIARFTDALMDVRIGPVVEAIDPYRRPHDETVGDLVSRDDPYARERMRDSIGDATAGIGVIVDELAVLAPALRRSIEDSRRRMENAILERRAARRDYDRDYRDDYDPDMDYDR